MKKNHLFSYLRMLSLVVMLTCGMQAFALNYYDVRVASSPTGAGKVYVKAADANLPPELAEYSENGKELYGNSRAVLKYDNVKDGYYFLGWSNEYMATTRSDILSTGNEAEINLDDNKPVWVSKNLDVIEIDTYNYSFFANFSRLQVQSASEEQGTAGFLGTKYGAWEGETARLKASPKAGYKFVGWKRNDGDGYVSTDNPYSVDVADATAGTYTAYFTATEETPTAHSVCIDECVHGSLEAIHTSATPGEMVTLTVTPDEYYETYSVIYDGMKATQVGNTQQFTFEMPNDDVYVSLVCKPIVYSITYELDGGSVSPSNIDHYTVETENTQLVNPTRDGYDFAGWTGTGLDAPSMTVTVPQGFGGDRTYTATWTERVLELANNGNNSSAIEAAAREGKMYNRVIISDRNLYCDGFWNTLTLPFNVSELTGTPLEGFTVMELDDDGNYEHPTGFDDGTLYLNFKVASNIEAGKPYILKIVNNNAADVKLTATAGTIGKNDNVYSHLFDNSPTSQWYTDKDCKENPNDPYYCEFNAHSVITLTGYTLYVAPNEAALSNRTFNPTKWTLKAKLTEGGEWTVVDSRDATVNPEDALPDVNDTENASKAYAIASDKQGDYRFFRLEVSQTSAPGSDQELSLYELKLQGTSSHVPGMTFNGVTIDAEDRSVTSADGKVTFKGTYQPIVWDSKDRSILFLGAQNTLYYPQPSGGNSPSIGAFRAYFQLADGITAVDPVDGIRAFMLNFGDSETSGIITTNSMNITNGAAAWYTLDGRKLNGKPTKKGLYINNGRKFPVK